MYKNLFFLYQTIEHRRLLMKIETYYKQYGEGGNTPFFTETHVKLCVNLQQISSVYANY